MDRKSRIDDVVHNWSRTDQYMYEDAVIQISFHKPGKVLDFSGYINERVITKLAASGYIEEDESSNSSSKPPYKARVADRKTTSDYLKYPAYVDEWTYHTTTLYKRIKRKLKHASDSSISFTIRKRNLEEIFPLCARFGEEGYNAHLEVKRSSDSSIRKYIFEVTKS